MRIAVYAGTFDPFTKGHLSVLQGALKAFQRVVVAVGHNTAKKTLLSFSERREILEIYRDELPQDQQARVIVDSFDGLLTDYCAHLRNRDLFVDGTIPDEVCIVRGLRVLSDFESEMAIADANRNLNPLIQTVFIPAEAECAFVSSSVVREIAYYNAAHEMVKHLDPKTLKPLYKYLIPKVADLLVQKMKLEFRRG